MTGDNAINTNKYRDLIEWSRTLRAEMEIVRGQSRSLIQRGRDRRLTSTYAGLRQIGGGSDDPTDIVEAGLDGASVCIDCLVFRTGLLRDEVVVALRVLLRVRAVDGDGGVCGSC